jgi:peptidoglycan/xylan/chitin deacetylase (PgdA/CDA1 family)
MTYRLNGTSHFLTFDVTDGSHVPKILDLLGAARTSATFFLSAAVAREEREAAQMIARAGHEVAAYSDERADDWSPFRDSARETKALIEDTCGTHVRGFRAAAGVIGPHTPWAFEILVEEGYDYDSSCVPDRGGPRRSGVPDYAYSVLCGSGSLVELPITVVDPRGRALQARTRGGLPGVVAFACQELSDEPARSRVPLVALALQYAHYDGKRATRERVTRLVRDFRFEAIGHRLNDLSFGSPTTFAA